MQMGEGLLPSPLLAMLEKKGIKIGFRALDMQWWCPGLSGGARSSQQAPEPAVKAGGREDPKEKEAFLGVGLSCQAPCKAVLSAKYIL